MNKEQLMVWFSQQLLTMMPTLAMLQDVQQENTTGSQLLGQIEKDFKNIVDNWEGYQSYVEQVKRS